MVNPPVTDPPLSPSIQPRHISAASDHAFAKACVYTSGLAVSDDDGGSTTGSLNVIIVGRVRGRPQQPPQPPARLLQAAGSSTNRPRLRRLLRRTTCSTQDRPARSRTWSTSSLLAGWLNFANGAIEWNRLVDTNGDKTPDTPFLSAIETAESLRIKPTATRSQVDTMKQIVESWTSLP